MVGEHSIVGVPLGKGTIVPLFEDSLLGVGEGLLRPSPNSWNRSALTQAARSGPRRGLEFGDYLFCQIHSFPEPIHCIYFLPSLSHFSVTPSTSPAILLLVASLWGSAGTSGKEQDSPQCSHKDTE